MIRIYIICEGQTEEMFVNSVLSEHFTSKSIYLTPILVGRPGHKGGNVCFDRLLIDIKARLGDTNAYCTTFFDFYGLRDDFPGKSEAIFKKNPKEKVDCVTVALKEGLAANINTQAMRRFIPYVQMYEFESLLFSSPQKFAKGIGQEQLTAQLHSIRGKFPTPEDINDSPITAPSKRIIQLFSEYEKPICGSLAAIEIGLQTIRKECLLFNEWITTLENLEDILV